jgi:hypothetical protein
MDHSEDGRHTSRPDEGGVTIRAVLEVATTQRVHGEKLDAILRLLQPSGEDRQGPSLEDLLKAIAERLDAQAEYLRIIAKEVTRQGTELPREIAAAVAGEGGAAKPAPLSTNPFGRSPA